MSAKPASKSTSKTPRKSTRKPTTKATNKTAKSSVKKTSKKLGVGIIGAGNMGAIHAQCFSALKDVSLVGIYNPTQSKAAALTKKFGGKVFESLESLLADPAINTIIITSPQAHHHEQAVAAAKAGKHILCEKPIALLPKEMEDITREVAKAGTTFMVGHQMRYHPVILAVKKALPKLGPLFAMDMEWAFLIAGHEGRCWTSYRLGGFFMELGCHAADLATFLMGPVKNLTANTLRLNPKRVTEDYTRAMIQFESNASGSIIVSANHRTQRQGMLRGRILGKNGRIDFTCYPYGRSHNTASLTLDGGKSVFVPDATTTRLKIDAPPSQFKVYPGFYDVYLQQAKAFVKAVQTGKTDGASICTLQDGKAAIQMVLGAYDQQSEATRKPNFRSTAKRYRSDETSHPLLGE